MDSSTRSNLAARLTSIMRLALDELDALAADRDVALGNVDALHTEASELLASVVEMRRAQGELVSAGGYVLSPGDLVEVDDVGAQKAMTEMHLRRVG